MILRRLPDSRFSEVLPKWLGESAVIIGGGPSLTLEQVGRVCAAHAHGEVRCIAVNDGYLLAPWADAQFAADSHWHKWHEAGIGRPLLGLKPEDVRDRWASFAGQKCTIENSGANVTDDRVHMLRNRDFPKHGMGLSLDPCALVTGRNSGFQAMNIAVLAGAKTIILIGFDGSTGEGGKSHWFGSHPRPTPEAVYPYYREAMTAAQCALQAAGVTVLNATPGSAIDAFERVTLEDLL